MDPWRGVVGAAWVPLLSGCMMMGGMGHMGRSTISAPGDVDSRDSSPPLKYAEASSGDLTIVLSFADPIVGGGPVPIDARLSRDGAHGDSNDDVVWLLIEAPDGRVDEVPMQHILASSAGTYRALCHFNAPGLYLITAEGRAGTGADMAAVSVTTRAEVRDGPQADTAG
jgi:hypothetical protein